MFEWQNDSEVWKFISRLSLDVILVHNDPVIFWWSFSLIFITYRVIVGVVVTFLQNRILIIII